MARRRSSNSFTIRDVAKKSGVSVATVSRYINRNAPVSPKVAKRLDKVMAELKYVPRAAARNLRLRLLRRTLWRDLHRLLLRLFARRGEVRRAGSHDAADQAR